MTNKIDLLILHGPPGAGKSSIAKTIAAELRSAKIMHTIIELDDLAKIYPRTLLHIMYENLAAIWPNYEKLGEIKVIIPTYLQKGEYEIVRQATPAKRQTLCEITVPQEELISRINQRENDEAVQKRLAHFVNGYQENRAEDKYVDMRVANDNRDLQTIAKEIINKLGWSADDKITRM